MTTPSAGARRAAREINQVLQWQTESVTVEQLATLIDRETNHDSLVEAAKAARVQFEYMLNEVPEAYHNMGSEIQSRINEISAALAKVGAA